MSSWRTSTVPAAYVPVGSVKVPPPPAVQVVPPLMLDSHVAPTKSPATVTEALLVMPPYYINAPEEGLFQYFEAIGNSCGLPLSFYTRDWAAFSPSLPAQIRLA